MAAVVMPVRDPDPQVFQIAVRSILQQTMQDFELLIIEDAGPRPGQPSVRPVAAPLAVFADSRIRHIPNMTAGIASARNRGVAEARAPLIAMLDSDDIADPARLALQVAAMNAEPELCILGTQIRIIDEEGREIGSRTYPTDPLEIERLMSIYNPIAQPSVMFRKSSIQQLGGYQDRTCEDYDLWSRAARAGLRIRNLPTALVSYRLHTGAMKARKLRDSLKDTLAIKREHWSDRRSLRGRVRGFSEAGLLALPPRIVMAMFRRISLRSSKHP